jgi:hypothetical protein
MRRVALLPLAALFFAACEDVPTQTQVEGAAPQASISDAAHQQGNQHFFFLPPMVPQPTYSGTFDASLEPVVEICVRDGFQCDPTIATYTTETGPGSETVRVVLDPGDGHYIVNWHTDLADPGDYRIRVLGGDAFRLMGYADVILGSNRELRSVDTDQFVPLKDGRTLPIKFRIEEGAVSACTPPQSGLVSWWPGDADATDIQGSHDGTLMRGATIAPGFVGNAFSFDGYDDYVKVPDERLGGLFESGADFSITLWAYKVPDKVNPFMVSLMSAFECNSGLNWIFYGNGPSSSDYGFGIADIYTCAQLSVARFVEGVPHNEWVFGSVVYENANVFLYANGELVQTELEGIPGWIKPNPSKAGGLIIGTAAHVLHTPGNQAYYTGLIDEVQVYDRALSPDEIQLVFGAGSAGTCKY